MEEDYRIIISLNYSQFVNEDINYLIVRKWANDIIHQTAEDDKLSVFNIPDEYKDDILHDNYTIENAFYVDDSTRKEIHYSGHLKIIKE